MLLCVTAGALCTHRRAKKLQNSITKALYAHRQPNVVTWHHKVQGVVKQSVSRHRRANACSVNVNACLGRCLSTTAHSILHLLIHSDTCMTICSSLCTPCDICECMTVCRYAQQPYDVMTECDIVIRVSRVPRLPMLTVITHLGVEFLLQDVCCDILRCYAAILDSALKNVHSMCHLLP